MRTIANTVLLTLILLSFSPVPADGQRLGRAALGGTVGVAGGVAVSLAAITARARFQDEYLHAREDLIHWHSTPMILAPAVGVFFGWAGDDELRGSIVGSVSGLAVGASMGAGLGWLLSAEPDWPWAGGIIGGGVGLAIGGLLGGFTEWVEEDGRGNETPSAALMLTVPL